MFRWIGHFADHEPELFGGAANIADRDGRKWIMKTRENMHASTALAAPAREAPGAFVRIDAAGLAAEPADPVLCVRRNQPLRLLDGLTVEQPRAVPPTTARTVI